MSVYWQVVGGSKKGGILVREGKEPSSAEVAERLATGSFIRQSELCGDRLEYVLLLGSGPSIGWVSTKLTSGVELVQRTDKVLPNAPPPWWPEPPPSLRNALANRPPRRQAEPIQDRNLRILAMHGSGSNSNIIAFQIGRLRRRLGKDVTWLTPDGPVAWEKPLKPPGALPNNWYEERSEPERALARDKPFFSMLDLGEYEDGHSMDCIPDRVGESKAWFRELLAKESPIDVVVCFSQSADLVNKVLTDFSIEGLEAPWRLNLFFSPSPHGRFDIYCCNVPTWFVSSPEAGGEQDVSLYQLKEAYTDLVVLEHADGHAFPTSEPRATEIYTELAAAVKEHCLE